MDESETDTQPAEGAVPEEVGDCFGLVGTRLDGKYDVESVVAEGGFGVVYKGRHRGLEKVVAIKVLKIPPELKGPTRMEFLAKFALEARTIAKLEHSAVVRVMDFGACPMPIGEAAPWMAMDWLTGTTLEKDLAERAGRPRTPSEVLALMRPVLEALAEAHEIGVAHRDLKPANLMLVKTRGGEVQFKVLDFGIAKLMGAEEKATSGQTSTQSTLHAFSLYSAAPEQISGTRTGPWTDVHALALIVSEMLTGRAPYAGGDLTEVYGAVLSPQRPTPMKLGFDVGAWEPVLAKALSLKPADRYQSAGALRDALAAEVPGPQRAGSLVPEPQPPRVVSEVVTTLRPGFKSAQPSAPRGPMRAGRAAMAIVTTGLLAGVAWHFGQKSAVRVSPPAMVVAGRPTPVVPVVVTPVRPSAPESYRASVSVIPPTAALELDGLPAGTGSLTRDFVRDGVEHRLLLSADGYVTRTVSFRDGPPPESIRLDALPAGTRGVVAGTGARHPRRGALGAPANNGLSPTVRPDMHEPPGAGLGGAPPSHVGVNGSAIVQ